MRTGKRKSRRATGQLSIFAILIFQTLFMFFAMSLNIALVVHDKINLQNSVDIAAYYGAMKQAEMLNAIAHINYQIRQSWKLLVWRYRVLGSIGTINAYPSSHASNMDTEYRPITYPGRLPGPYFFCLGHDEWGKYIGRLSSAQDLLCTKMNHAISSMTVPAVTGTLGSFIGMLTGVRDMAIATNTRLRDMCNIYGYNSWLFGVMSVVHFRRDQNARKYMMHELARVMSGARFNHPHGSDIDGNSIEMGVRKTFIKNLSFINKNSFNKSTSKLKHFNSLSNPQPRSPGNWLIDQPFYDMALYSRIFRQGSDCKKELSFLYTPPPSATGPQVATLLNEIAPLGSDPWPQCAQTKKCLPSAGMKKEKNFIIFYSLKAEIDYGNQIFLPFSQNITLKARAFAKPFGGRIGPDTHENGDRADPRLPPHPPPPHMPTSLSEMDFDINYAPNYSRYPGDPYGLRSSVVHYNWAKYIRSQKTENKIKNYIKLRPGDIPYIDHDPLARDSDQNPSLSVGAPARKWELAAIAPDLFDITYFTILPYYSYTYFPKIIHLISDPEHIRGDLGTYKALTGQFLNHKTLIHQVGYDPSHPHRNIWADLNNLYLSLGGFRRPFYAIPDLKLLLTGWNPPKEKYRPGDMDYEALRGKTNFAECHLWVHPSIDPNSPGTQGKIANGCIYGGRTGYSVKMVSQAFLKGFSGVTNAVPQGDPEWWP